eukprot:CAMPEP_0194307364 /NCGR_PEP_ID=MMETSP0171-20130528/4267_1 /TAXON_ID=218684 /ORGANISM="Corethron pennatum, Strain L29A3" /LENGTH=90 /DNA_ID=CAMNT_0039059413 /DNA_START=99 /DNA_END=368 /DNA_ORIENTATION=-
MAPKKVKGTTLNLKDFMGGAPVKSDGLPTAPRQRGEGDDGSFQRAPRKFDSGGGGFDRDAPSRSEEDSMWRRGGQSVPSGGERGGGGGGG